MFDNKCGVGQWCGISVGLVWGQCGISVGSTVGNDQCDIIKLVCDQCGINVGSVWDQCGISVGPVCDKCGMIWLVWD